jgi:hypothetical protein
MWVVVVHYYLRSFFILRIQRSVDEFADRSLSLDEVYGDG